jgi:hypothetical protein
MKKIIYTGTIPKLSILNVGEFVPNEPKDVDDKIADLLVKKGDFKYLVIEEYDKVIPKKEIKKVSIEGGK